MADFVLFTPAWWAVVVCRLLRVAIVWNVGVVFSMCGGSALVWEVGIFIRVTVSALCCVTGIFGLFGLILGVELGCCLFWRSKSRSCLMGSRLLSSLGF